MFPQWCTACIVWAGSPHTAAVLCDATLQAADRAPLGQETPGEEGAVGIAGRKTLETVTAADEIIEALDLAADEEERFKEFEQVGWGGAGMGGWGWRWGGGR